MALREDIYTRAKGQCECTMKTCDHHTGRCTNLLRGSSWDLHRLTAGGAYVPSNVLAMCEQCHPNTPSYGVGKR